MILALVIMFVFGFLVGAAMGSAFLCFLSRKHTGESWTKGRSHCDSCNHTLAIKDLIPVFSFLFSKGKCRYCNDPIPAIALISELVFGIMFCIAFVLIGLFWTGFISPMVAFIPAAILIIAAFIIVLLMNKGSHNPIKSQPIS